MKDIHCSLLRLMEGIDQEVQEAPTLAGYGSAADLSPHEAYRYLLIAVAYVFKDPRATAQPAMVAPCLVPAYVLM